MGVYVVVMPVKHLQLAVFQSHSYVRLLLFFVYIAIPIHGLSEEKVSWVYFYPNLESKPVHVR
jgi:hypothetical protein